MIKLPSYFTGFSSKADGSASLRFATQELTAENFVDLKRHQNEFAWLVFGGADSEIPDKAPVREGKTPSERLRNRMFVFWKENKIETPFEVWREGQLEKIGERYLEKISN